MNATVIALLIAQTELAQADVAETDFGRGIAIALTGMAIVAFALLLIIAFISSLPHVLGFVAQYFPEKQDPHVRKSHPESQVADDEAVVAAIGYVLHLQKQQS